MSLWSNIGSKVLSVAKAAVSVGKVVASNPIVSAVVGATPVGKVLQVASKAVGAIAKPVSAAVKAVAPTPAPPPVVKAVTEKPNPGKVGSVNVASALFGEKYKETTARMRGK